MLGFLICFVGSVKLFWSITLATFNQVENSMIMQCKNLSDQSGGLVTDQDDLKVDLEILASLMA